MSNLNSGRLREARIIRGLTLDDLASKVGVTKQAISKYENGSMSPSTDTLVRIINGLDVPLSFITKEEIISNENRGNCNFFRKLKKTKNAEVDMVRVHAKWFMEVANGLVTIDSSGVSGLRNIAKQSGTISEKAMMVRNLWGLGYDPINNLISVFENNGIFITNINIKNSDFDAYTEIVSNRVFIVLNTANITSVRQRFNLAHELGHIILHSEYNWSNATKEDLSRLEKEAHLFANEFLIPTEAFRAEFISDKIGSLILLKKRWGISIQALMYRARELSIISEDRYMALVRQMSARGMKKQEPLDNETVAEMPTYFNNLIREKYNDGSEVNTLLNAVRMSAKDIEKVLVLNDGLLSQYSHSQTELGIHEISNLQLSIFDIRGES